MMTISDISVRFGVGCADDYFSCPEASENQTRLPYRTSDLKFAIPQGTRGSICLIPMNLITSYA